TGTGSFTQAGAGTTTLNAANTFSGNTLVSAGVLNIQNATALGTTANGTSVTGGAALQIQNNITVGAEALALNGTGIASDGALRNISGTNVWQGTVTLGSAARINSDAGSLTFDTAANSITGTQNLTLGGAGNGTVGGNITTGTGTLTKDGAGTWTLKGPNTYTGLTTVSEGVLNIQNTTALGTTANGTSVTGGAALQIQNNITVGAEALALNGTGIASDGALRNISGTNVWQGTVTLGSAARINSDAGSLTFDTAANSITGTQNLTLGGAGNGTVGGNITTGTGTLTKDGAGTWTLKGPNTYTGLTTVSAGVLNIQNTTALGTTAAGISVTSGAALQLQGDIAPGETLTLNGMGISNDGALRSISGNNGWNAAVTLGSNTRVNSDSGTMYFLGAATISGNYNLTLGGAAIGGFNGNIGIGTGTLTKDGAGTWTINANTFSGNTLVSAGTLILAGYLTNSALDTSGAGVITLSALTTPTLGGLIGSKDLASVITTGYTSVTALTLNPGTGASNTYSGAIANGAAGMTLTKTGSGTQILSGTNTYTGNTTITAGSLQLGNGSTTGNLSTSSVIVDNANLTVNRSNAVAQGTDFSAAAITGTGSFTQAGAGTTTLNATNTYGGLTTVAKGTLSFTSGNVSATANQALGANATVNLGVATTSSGILNYTGTGAATLAKAINALGNGTDTIQNSGTGQLTLSGTLTKNGTVLTLKGGSNGINVTGAIVGSNSNSDLIVDGGNTTLSATNTYNGPTYLINGANLTANATAALPTANGRTAISMDQTGSGSSILALGGSFSQAVASLTGNMTSAVHLNANTLTVGTSGNSTTFAGVISGTNGNVIKDGTSTQVLTGNNTYTGTTTVSAGTLEAAAAGALGTTSAITVTTTGTLLLSANAATSGNALTMSNGTVALIKTGTGVSNTLGTLTLTENSIIDFGSITAGNNILTLGAVTTWTSGKTIEIWNWSGTPRTSGGTDRLIVSSKTGWEDNLNSINFYSGSGSGLIGTAMFDGYELVAVPEPATWSYMAAIALGGAVLVLRRRRLIGIRN
ncbi:MAG: autotransporter-associated beta strand repeat-containing protein, partial [Verrucomicrobiae bacterium]